MQQEDLEILYQDNDLIAIQKPSGLLVHKSPIDKHETRYAMKLLRNQIGQWVYPVHRLDKPTSGLLLFALSSEVAKQVSQDFEERRIEKEYQAIVRGWTDAGLIDKPLKEIAVFKHQQKNVERLDAKEAQTAYETLDRYELPFSDGRFNSSRYSLLLLKPKTGRKHQIRRHLKHLSHPIIGDVKYGKGEHNRLFKEKLDSHRLLLAATKLTFLHPVSRERVTIECPIEKNMQNVLEKLSEYKAPTQH